MEERDLSRPWFPAPFRVAVLESDETLADTLCGLLREKGLAPAAFYEIGSLVSAHGQKPFDAYVLDYLAAWQPESPALEALVASIRGADLNVPLFILGNQAHPETNEKLGNILMRFKVRYVLKPYRAVYLAREIAEAIAVRAGL